MMSLMVMGVGCSVASNLNNIYSLKIMLLKNKEGSCHFSDNTFSALWDCCLCYSVAELAFDAKYMYNVHETHLDEAPLVDQLSDVPQVGSSPGDAGFCLLRTWVKRTAIEKKSHNENNYILMWD